MIICSLSLHYGTLVYTNSKYLLHVLLLWSIYLFHLLFTHVFCIKVAHLISFLNILLYVYILNVLHLKLALLQRITHTLALKTKCKQKMVMCY